MRTPLLFFSLVFASAVAAQEPDTTAPARYVPLEIGNRWEYTYAEGQTQAVLRGYRRWVVRTDTTVAGSRYLALDQTAYSVEGDPTSRETRYVRFDTPQARLVEWRGGADVSFAYAPCPFNLPFEGGACRAAGYGATQAGLGYSQNAGLGVLTSVKRFELGITGYAVRWAAGLGFVLYETIIPKAGEIEMRLRYARINGVSYGTPIPVLPVVVSAGPDPSAPPFALAVAPNPSGTGTRARLTLTLDTEAAVAVTVHDALGREVAWLHDGPLAAGTHAFTLDGAALPAGVYVARATADGATATARLTLTR